MVDSAAGVMVLGKQNEFSGEVNHGKTNAG
jgi:hypothetical protein